MQHSNFYNQLVKDGTLVEYMQQIEEIKNRLGSAFIWKNSPSGITYWANLSYKYPDGKLSNYDINVLKNEYPEYFI